MIRFLFFIWNQSTVDDGGVSRGRSVVVGQVEGDMSRVLIKSAKMCQKIHKKVPKSFKKCPKGRLSYYRYYYSHTPRELVSPRRVLKKIYIWIRRTVRRIYVEL